MASTIQIKYGSGSNTPTAGALANAELALNVDTGQLWYGSGSSPVTQSEFKFLNITASSSTGSFTGSFLGTFTSADIVALKLESASLLSYTASNNAEIVALKTITASLIAEDTSLKTITASLIAEDTSLKTKTASLDASITSFKLETASLHTFTASGFQSPLSMSVGTTLSNTTNLAGTPLYVHGTISSSHTIIGRDITAARHISGGFKLSINTASIGTPSTNTTNLAGTPLYVHGKISASGDIQGSTLTGTLQTAAQTNITSVGDLTSLTAVGQVTFENAELFTGPNLNATFPKITLTSASIGTELSNTTNIAGTPLYVHGNISSSKEIEGKTITSPLISSSNKMNALTASFGTLPSVTTNIAGTPLYVHGNISSSANIYAADYYTSGKKVRPNLYWFAVCDAITTAANENLGDFPSTDVSVVSFNATTLTSDTGVFTLSSDVVTITRAGVYKFTYNVLLEITAGSNRTEGTIGILRTPSGGSVALIDGSRSSTYNRFNAGADVVSRGAGSVSMLIDVAANDAFYIGFYKEAHHTTSTKLRTVPSGTTWTIEAVT